MARTGWRGSRPRAAVRAVGRRPATGDLGLETVGLEPGEYVGRSTGATSQLVVYAARAAPRSEVCLRVLEAYDAG